MSTLNAEVQAELGYLMTDADQHSTPAHDAYEKYIDPDKRHMAIRTVKTDDGKYERLYNGRPASGVQRTSRSWARRRSSRSVGVKGAGADKRVWRATAPRTSRQPASSPARC